MSDLLSNVGGFAKGFGEGVWGGAKGMVQGLGSLAQGAYNLATDPNARSQAWNDAVNAAQTAEWAVQNPGQAADAVGQGATNLYNNFSNAEQQAVANGQGAEFWGNVAGQGAFAAGTVLVPGLAEGKLAGAAGELGDAGQLVKAGTALEDAAPALGDAAEGATTAPALPDPNALSFVPENSGAAQNAAGQFWRDYQAQTIGADTNPLTGESNVPALQFDNPNPNGNPYVKWDGFQQLPDGTTELIDAKTTLSPFSTADGPFVPPSTIDQLLNKSAALDQNPGYTGVLEFPTDQAATHAQNVLDNLGITNLDVRVRPFQDPGATIPDVTTPDATLPSDVTTPPADLTPPADGTASTGDALTFPNTGNLLGAGVLGAGALGNTLSPPTSDPTTDSTALTTPDLLPLYSATYGVNPDGSLTTLSPPALVSPGDMSIAPPQPDTPAPVDETPATPPPSPPPATPAPADAAAPTPSPPPATPAPVDATPVVDPTPPSPPPVTPAPVDVAPIDPIDPTLSDPGISPDSGISSDLGASSDLGISSDPGIDNGGAAMGDMAMDDASC